MITNEQVCVGIEPPTTGGVLDILTSLPVTPPVSKSFLVGAVRDTVAQKQGCSAPFLHPWHLLGNIASTTCIIRISACQGCG